MKNSVIRQTLYRHLNATSGNSLNRANIRAPKEGMVEMDSQEAKEKREILVCKVHMHCNLLKIGPPSKTLPAPFYESYTNNSSFVPLKR